MTHHSPKRQRGAALRSEFQLRSPYALRHRRSPTPQIYNEYYLKLAQNRNDPFPGSYTDTFLKASGRAEALTIWADRLIANGFWDEAVECLELAKFNATKDKRPGLIYKLIADRYEEWGMLEEAHKTRQEKRNILPRNRGKTDAPQILESHIQ